MNLKNQHKGVRHVSGKIRTDLREISVKVVFAVISAWIVIGAEDDIIGVGAPDLLHWLIVVGFIAIYQGLHSTFFGNTEPWSERLTLRSILRAVAIVLLTGLIAILLMIGLEVTTQVPAIAVESYTSWIEIGTFEIASGIALLVGYWASSNGFDRLAAEVSRRRS